MPYFRYFKAEMREVFDLVKKEHGEEGEVPQRGIVGLDDVDPNDFGVAVCTVDGQRFSLGKAHTPRPLADTVKPLLYALALKDVGRNELHRWVGLEPTAADPFGFGLLPPRHEEVAESQEDRGHRLEELKDAIENEGYTMSETQRPPHPTPFNPFTDAGALTLCSTIGRAQLKKEQRLFHDSGSRFQHIISHLTAWGGGNKVGFDNPVFLGMKSNRLETLAVSHYIKGMGCYPKKADPTDICNFFFQTESIEMTAADLAVVAGTIANVGVCPTTSMRCLDRTVVRQVLSLMYNCGLNRGTGKWQFQVGIPATAGRSGYVMVRLSG